MFTGISWTSYITVLLVLLAGYYVFVSIRFYSRELKEILTGKRRLTAALPGAGRKDQEKEIPFIQAKEEVGSFNETSEETFQYVEKLVSQLKQVVLASAQAKMIPQEFSYRLISTLKQYPGLKYSPFTSSINELILSECEKLGYDALSEEDVVRLWSDVS